MNYEPVNIPYKATGERSVSYRRQLQEPVEVPAPMTIGVTIASTGVAMIWTKIAYTGAPETCRQ